MICACMLLLGPGSRVQNRLCLVLSFQSCASTPCDCTYTTLALLAPILHISCFAALESPFARSPAWGISGLPSFISLDGTKSSIGTPRPSCMHLNYNNALIPFKSTYTFGHWVGSWIASSCQQLQIMENNRFKSPNDRH